MSPVLAQLRLVLSKAERLLGQTSLPGASTEAPDSSPYPGSKKHNPQHLLLEQRGFD